MKAEIENIDLAYCVDVSKCKNEKDFQRKGREAKRTMVKMLAKKLWEDNLVKFEIHPEFSQGVVIVKAELPVLKEMEK